MKFVPSNNHKAMTMYKRDLIELQNTNNLQTANHHTVFRKLPGKYKSKIGISTSEGTHILNVNTIMYCEAQSNYTKIHFTDGRNLMVSKTLRRLEDKLPKSEFKRCHMSYLVNINEVCRFGDQLEMNSGKLLPISRSKKNEIRDWFTDLVSFI